MKIDEKFNKRGANLIEVQTPSVRGGPQYALGLVAEFFRLPGDADHSTIKLHMTPGEALHFAEELIKAARFELRDVLKGDKA
jgi:hypothetical protein